MNRHAHHGIEHTGKIRVWDPFLRIFHWLFAASFIIAYLSGEEILSLHIAAGYLITVLLVSRVFWGFIGPRHARFSDFIRSPSTALNYLRDLFTGRSRRYLGHNPAGGMMILLLLVMVFVICISGFVIYGIEEHAGPLAAYLQHSGETLEDLSEELHEGLANVTLFLVFIHIGGVIVESLVHRENLVKAMIDGMKRAPEPSHKQDSNDPHKPFHPLHKNV